MTMLDRMRRHRSWLKWSLGLVAVTMVIFFIPQDYLRPSTTVGAAPSETIAEVNGRALLAGDFQQRYLQQMQQYTPAVRRRYQRAAASPAGRRPAGAGADDRRAGGDHRGGAPPHPGQRRELAQQIFAIPAFQDNGQFIGEQRYEQLLQSQNPPVTKSQFEDG
jgi:hypothetical protein